VPVLTYEIDPSYLLNIPPELTPDVAVRRWREINILLHSVALLGDEMEGQDPLLPLLRASSTMVTADRALLYEWDEGRRALVLAGSLGVTDAATASLASGNTQAQTCVVHRKPVIVSSPREGFLQEELAALEARGVLSVPIAHQGLPWGCLQLARSRPFMREEAVLLWLFAMVVEGVLPFILHIRHHREKTASTDTESGLQTPAHFRRRLAWELQRAAWVARPVTVACIEITEMLHGRPRGGSLSVTPREAARIVCKALRPADSVTCLGGHHFIAALPDTDPAGARRMLDVIREAFLSRMASTLPVFDIVTGLSVFPDDGREEADLIRSACASARKLSRTPLAG